jgi:4-hydroxy-3-methylbut-2-enyl diphosphate reductase
LKIELAKSYGFCYGVKRAIDIAEKHPESVTFGPLIHNKDEINRLAKNHNVGLVETLEDALEHDTVIIRTHGITKERLKTLKADGKKIINATCPYVTTPQQIVEKMSKEGYTIVIFGDEKHPEIQGVASYSVTPQRTFTVLDKSELIGLPLGGKVALVAQTTRKPDAYQEIAAALVVRVQELRVFNTICNATFENQDATEELAKKSDIMIVVGGKNSSNTKQLFSICQNNLESCYHIENSSELEASWFEGKEHCGVTAGASTPDWIIEDVTKKIKELTAAE